MIELIKYLPLGWRERNDYCRPQGPKISSAAAVCIPVAGSRLRFRAPPHAPLRRSVEERSLPHGLDALGDGRLYKTYGGNAMANSRWGFRHPFIRQWTFWGPWMSGAKAQLRMMVNVVGRFEEFEFLDASFFHPRAFEIVVTQYLNDSYGHSRWDGANEHLPRYRGPLDWKVHNHLPVFSASCSVYKVGMDGETLFSPRHLFFLPITDKHFVEVSFLPDLYALENGKPTFDISPIQELQDAILDSITLELSPEAQAAYDKVKAECPDMKLSDHFPPLKWPTGPSQSDEADQQLHSEQLKRLSS